MLFIEDLSLILPITYFTILELGLGCADEGACLLESFTK